MIAQTAGDGSDAPRIPWADFVKFVRQLSHDLRNQLNAAELQAALLNELATDDEVRNEVQRLRKLVGQLGHTLQQLSASVAEPRPTTIPYPVSELVEDLRKKITQSLGDDAAHIRWGGKVEGAEIVVDPNLLETAMVELLRNAFQHGRGTGEVELKSEMRENEFALSLSEPKDGPLEGEHILRQPLHHVSHGHYGLGRHRVEGIMEAHGGRLETTWDAATKKLTHTLILPCSPVER